MHCINVSILFKLHLSLMQAAAMFKVLRDTPPIPETLSSEGKNFLRCCFQRNPAERPSAARLLEHRFLKNSQQLDIPSCNPSFIGKNLTVNRNAITFAFAKYLIFFFIYNGCLTVTG